MSSMDTLDVGQANELKLACRRNDFTADDLKWLCERNTLAMLREIRQGRAEVKYEPNLINLDHQPFVPRGWSIVWHKADGMFDLNFGTTKLLFPVSRKSHDGKMGKKELDEVLQNERPLNATALDYLIATPYAIPEGWRGKHVTFLGTLYKNDMDHLVVRTLYWNGMDFTWNWIFYGNPMDETHPIALRAD